MDRDGKSGVGCGLKWLGKSGSHKVRVVQEGEEENEVNNYTSQVVVFQEIVLVLILK